MTIPARYHQQEEPHRVKWAFPTATDRNLPETGPRVPRGLDVLVLLVLIEKATIYKNLGVVHHPNLDMTTTQSPAHDMSQLNLVLLGSGG
jgi:hypothetical protein